MRTTLITIFFSLALAAVAQENIYVPFFTSKEAPQLEAILPAPPDYGSLNFTADCQQYQWGLAQRVTDRGRQAREDAFLNADFFLQRFSPAMHRELSAKAYPVLYRLIARTHATEWNCDGPVKAYHHRVRPYQQFHEATSVPEHENPDDHTSYPSGHTMASWLVGMVLSAIDTDHATEIMQVAYQLGQSRVIVGFHYQSDVDAGRLAASILFARMCAEPEFVSMLNQAREELGIKGI